MHQQTAGVRQPTRVRVSTEAMLCPPSPGLSPFNRATTMKKDPRYITIADLLRAAETIKHSKVTDSQVAWFHTDGLITIDEAVAKYGRNTREELVQIMPEDVHKTFARMKGIVRSRYGIPVEDLLNQWEQEGKYPGYLSTFPIPEVVPEAVPEGDGQAANPRELVIRLGQPVRVMIDGMAFDVTLQAPNSTVPSLSFDF